MTYALFFLGVSFPFGFPTSILCSNLKKFPESDFFNK
jgi:hypothetical protein